jgi:NAD+ kinase
MAQKIGKTAVIANLSKASVLRNLGSVVSFLGKAGVSVLLEPEAAEAAGRAALSAGTDEMRRSADLVVVLGGDGTFLYAAGLFHATGVAMLGVNFGTVGFLNEVPFSEFRTVLADVLKGRFTTQKRMVLEASVNGRGTGYPALNDLTISRGALSRTIGIRCLINGHVVGSYKADGVIVATPTGSTAYSLSAGGPVISPDLDSIVINPICPHTLAVRPLVVGPDEEIAVRFDSGGEDPAYLTIDGQKEIVLGPGEEVLIRRSRHPVAMIVTRSWNFYELLGGKLLWKR